MNQKEIENFLNKKPSYIKKGKKYLSNLLNASEEDCEKILKKMRKKIAVANNIEVYGKDNILNEKNDIEVAALNYYISIKQYDKASDLLQKLKDDKSDYIQPNVKEGVYIVIGCLHLPFHNYNMLRLLVNIIAEEENLAGIVLAGDILDMHSISRHSKGSITLLNYDLSREYEEANAALDLIDDAIGDREIMKEFFYGNHEDWYNQWGKNVDNWKLGDSGAISPYDACFKHRNYNTQFNWKTAKVDIGDYRIIHGEWTNIHSAYKHATSLHKSIIFFHTHRFNSYYEETIEGLNCGWGGNKKEKVFNYMSESQKIKWRNGFCKITVTDNGSFATPIPLINNQFEYNGKIYK